MANFRNAQLELPDGAHAPDPWDHSRGVELRLDHVISKDEDGSPLSRVGDFVWDWTYCTPLKTPSFLYFYFWNTQGGEKSL